MKAVLGSRPQKEADSSIGHQWDERCKVPLGLC